MSKKCKILQIFEKSLLTVKNTIKKKKKNLCFELVKITVFYITFYSIIISQYFLKYINLKNLLF